MNKLQKVLRLRSQNDIELHVEEIRRRGREKKLGENEYEIFDLDIHKNEIIEQLENAEYNDLEDVVFRMELIYSEFEKILDGKYIAT